MSYCINQVCYINCPSSSLFGVDMRYYGMYFPTIITIIIVGILLGMITYFIKSKLGVSELERGR